MTGDGAGPDPGPGPAAPARVRRRVVVVDARDVEAESALWAGLLGGSVVRDAARHSTVVAGEWVMGVQLAASLGGRLLQEPRPPAEDPDGGELSTVWASPAGHPVCSGSH